jgi:hypothetical protein
MIEFILVSIDNHNIINGFEKLEFNDYSEMQTYCDEKNLYSIPMEEFNKTLLEDTNWVLNPNTGLITKLEDNSVIVNEMLEKLKFNKKNELNQICELKIISGFISNALGSDFLYDSDVVDQLNILGAVALGTDVGYKCLDLTSGIKNFYTHTNEQMKKVLGDGAIIKIGLIEQNTYYKNLVDACTTKEEIEAIIWA